MGRHYLQCPQCRTIRPYSRAASFECPSCDYTFERYEVLPRTFPDIFKHERAWQAVMIGLNITGFIALARALPIPWYTSNLIFLFAIIISQALFFTTAVQLYQNKFRYTVPLLQNAVLQERLHQIFVPFSRSRRFKVLKILCPVALFLVQAIYYWYRGHKTELVFITLTGESVAIGNGINHLIFLVLNGITAAIWGGHVVTLVLLSIVTTRRLLFPPERAKRPGATPIPRDYAIKVLQQVYDRKFLRFFLVGLGIVGTVMMTFGAAVTRIHGSLLDGIDFWMGLVYVGAVLLFYFKYYRRLVHAIDETSFQLHMCSVSVFPIPSSTPPDVLPGSLTEPYFEKIFKAAVPRIEHLFPILPGTPEKWTPKTTRIPGEPDSWSVGYRTFPVNVNFTIFFATLGRVDDLLVTLVSTRAPKREDLTQLLQLLHQEREEARGTDFARKLRAQLPVQARFCLAEGFTSRDSRDPLTKLSEILAATPEDEELVEELLFHYRRLKNTTGDKEVEKLGTPDHQGPPEVMQ